MSGQQISEHVNEEGNAEQMSGEQSPEHAREKKRQSA